MNDRRTPAAIGAAMSALTFVAYLPGLGRSLDFDSAETVGLFVRDGPPWSAFGRQAVFNNHPFFSFLEQIVRVGTGRMDAATMRILPIAFGALTVGVLAWYCTRRFGAIAGIAAGALVAANVTFANFSRSVRGYSLLALCALVSVIIVIDEVSPDDRVPRAFGRRAPTYYVFVTAAGLATHLFMMPVVAAEVGMLAAARRLDQAWRERLLTVALLAALAYMFIAKTMLDAGREMGRLFQPRLPVAIAGDVLGSNWTAILLAPLVAAGVVLMFRNRAVTGGVVAFALAFAFIWLVERSATLTPRFFVFLVPIAGLALAVAVGRYRPLAVVVVIAVALAVVAMLDNYELKPSSYREAAALIRFVNAEGKRSCVVDVGVSPMEAYVDAPRDFSIVTEPEQLGACDLVVVASWWPDSTASWYQQDLAVIAAAETQFDHKTVLKSDDSALVFSRQPVEGTIPA